MIFIVVKPFRTSKKEYSAGDRLEVSNEDIIRPLIENGLIKSTPEFGWCYSVCMLTPTMRKLCERAKPCPKEVFYE